MKFSIDMPLVASCDVARCAYNLEGGCHAKAITVGDGVHPGCDTFLGSERHPEEEVPNAGVGACKVALCRHNHELECEARAIQVGCEGDEPTCLTFELP